MFIAERRLREGQVIPWWLGVSYSDPTMRQIVCYPLPFNWVMQWWRSFRYWVVAGPSSNAVDEAMSEGLRVGFQRGRESFIRRIEEQLDEDARRREEERVRG